MLEKSVLLSLIESTLDAVLPPASSRPAELAEAMRYAVGTGGKRIRPLVCLAAAAAAGGDWREAAFAAAGIEMLHNYTLVHDDLPAMDNDIERRGRPTVWKKFGEANAILVGDALQALAFATAAKSPRNAAAVTAELARAAYGVVCGQVGDLELERGHAAPDAADYVYEHKTSDLFIAAAAMGALAVGAAPAAVAALREFGLNLGLAFQYEDDLLDGDGAYDREETRRRVAATTAAAIAALGDLPGDASFLRALAGALVDRRV